MFCCPQTESGDAATVATVLISKVNRCFKHKIRNNVLPIFHSDVMIYFSIQYLPTVCAMFHISAPRLNLGCSWQLTTKANRCHERKVNFDVKIKFYSIPLTEPHSVSQPQAESGDATFILPT
jgi:hypothetical protein